MLFDIIGKFNGFNGSASQSAPSDDKTALVAATDRAASLEARAEALSIVPKASPPSSTPKASTLESGVEIKGTIKCTLDLFFDGCIEGEIHSAGTLTLGANACVKGSIHSRTVVIFGRVEGTIAAQERCELKEEAHVFGDITAGSLSIEEGATFMGQSKSGKRSVMAAPATIPAAPATIPAARVTAPAAPVIRLAA